MQQISGEVHPSAVSPPSLQEIGSDVSMSWHEDISVSADVLIQFMLLDVDLFWRLIDPNHWHNMDNIVVFIHDAH